MTKVFKVRYSDKDKIWAIVKCPDARSGYYVQRTGSLWTLNIGFSEYYVSTSPELVAKLSMLTRPRR